MITKALVKFIKIYQKFLSPILGQNCRFHPTCSQYAIEALTSHGLLKGLILTLKRVARCNPWGGSGIDKVPAGGKHGCN